MYHTSQRKLHCILHILPNHSYEVIYIQKFPYCDIPTKNTHPIIDVWIPRYRPGHAMAVEDDPLYVWHQEIVALKDPRWLHQ